MSSKRIKIFYWGRVVFWYGTIYLFSSMPNAKQRGPNFETFLGLLDFLSRKFAHLTEYALLMIFLYLAISKTFSEYKKSHFLSAFFLVIVLASLDEWHQTFVWGRTGTEMDVFIDMIGALMGFYFIVLRTALHAEKKNN